jgi:hypothetical protein
MAGLTEMLGRARLEIARLRREQVREIPAAAGPHAGAGGRRASSAIIAGLLLAREVLLLLGFSQLVLFL